MDKRLITALILCLAILFGWTWFSEKMGWTPKPTPPVAQTTEQPNPKSSGTDPNPTDTPGISPTQPAPVAADTAPPISPVVADDTERFERFEVGEPGQSGYYQARFSNKGGVLSELRTGNYFDKAGLTSVEKLETQDVGDDKGVRVHWAMLVSPSPSSADPRGSLALRAELSAKDLERVPLDRELWTGKPIVEPGAGGIERKVGMEYTLSPGRGVTFVKRLRFLPHTDQIHFELVVRNDALDDAKGLRSFLLTPATGTPAETIDRTYREPQAIALSKVGDGGSDPKIQPADPAATLQHGPLPTASPVDFAGVFGKYFAVLLRPADDNARGAMVGASWRGVHDDAYATLPSNAVRAWRQLETDVNLQLLLPAKGESRTWTFDVYAGPKQRQQLEAVDPAFGVILSHDLGFVSGISKVLLWILGVFHSLTQSWGVAIILLTITVRAILFPVNRRSQTSMARYQAKVKKLQPRIDELKKKYANDSTKLNQERAKLMQEEGALMPPVGGCLPPLLQIPVFIGLYRALGVSFDLRHASFAHWINDLSLPDHTLEINWNLPLFGHVPYLNILPPLMVVMWIWQQRSMPKPTDPQAAQMYKMMMFMPVVMGVFLYNYAAGLSLYMITQSTLGIIEQKIIRKHWPVDDTVVETKKKRSGFMQRMMDLQQQKLKEAEAIRAKKRKAAARR